MTTHHNLPCRFDWLCILQAVMVRIRIQRKDKATLQVPRKIKKGLNERKDGNAKGYCMQITS